MSLQLLSNFEYRLYVTCLGESHNLSLFYLFYSVCEIHQRFLHVFVSAPTDTPAEDTAANQATTTAAAPTNLSASSKLNRPSLSKIVLSLEGIQAKQHALQRILQALQIIYSR